MEKTMIIDSRVDIQEIAPIRSDVDLIKNEPMLFNCDLKSAMELGGPLTRQFIHNLNSEFLNSPDFIVDNRVHMLMPTWCPAIMGIHHDDVPRERSDGQPNYINPSYHAKHAMMLLGGGCATEFYLGKSEFPDVDLGKVYYREWHPMVLDKVKSGELTKFTAPFGKVIYFDCFTWHQAVQATENAWRFFIRATINTKRKPTNEIRRQVQVYLPHPMIGW